MNAAFAHPSCRKLPRHALRFGATWLPGMLLAAGTFASAAQPQSAKVESAGIEVSCGGQPVKNRSWTACGFTLLADAQGPQVAVMTPPGAIAVCARAGEDVEVCAAHRERGRSVLRFGQRGSAFRRHGQGGPFARRANALARGARPIGRSLLKVEQQKSNGAATLHVRTVAESGEVVVRMARPACLGRPASRCRWPSPWQATRCVALRPNSRPCARRWSR